MRQGQAAFLDRLGDPFLFAEEGVQHLKTGERRRFRNTLPKVIFYLDGQFQHAFDEDPPIACGPGYVMILTHDAYQTYMPLKPNRPGVHSNRGEVLRALGRHEEALAAYHRAVELQPQAPEFHFNLGNALLHFRRYEEALAEFQEALRLQPDLAQAHSGMGLALSALGRLDAAIPAFHRALHFRPRSGQRDCGPARRLAGGVPVVDRRAGRNQPHYPLGGLLGGLLGRIFRLAHR